MRFFLLKAELPVESGNTAMQRRQPRKDDWRDLDDLKPEAAYFLASHGKRTACLSSRCTMPHRFPNWPSPGSSLSAQRGDRPP